MLIRKMSGLDRGNSMRRAAHTGSWAEASPDFMNCANMFWWPAESQWATLFPEAFDHAGGLDVGKQTRQWNSQSIASSSEFYYLDCGRCGFVGNDSHYDPPPPNGDSGSGGSWCGPFKTWQTIYNYDIAYGLTPEETKLVLGGEAALWSEQARPTVLDTRSFITGRTFGTVSHQENITIMYTSCFLFAMELV
ncbi:hypothetical protein D5086_017665 [Populus alba]|uniref:Uncharacterized protein n=1 Tax=Populus alba TaxID=43335 RepID=A0ACC4BMM0_POPAL